jgi:hypothetical protein
MRAPASAAELLEVVRALLLLQGAILIANTLEATLFAVAFSGEVTPTVVATATAAITVFVARARLDAAGRGRRAILIIEWLLIATLAIDTALALFLTHQGVAMVAMLTRFVVPVSVIVLLRAVRRDSRASASPLQTTA